jgi:hypothetical protein
MARALPLHPRPQADQSTESALTLALGDLAASRSCDPEHLDDALHLLVSLRLELHQRIADTVRAARAAGLSWRELGILLGTSHQAAQARYDSPEEPDTT